MKKLSELRSPSRKSTRLKQYNYSLGDIILLRHARRTGSASLGK